MNSKQIKILLLENDLTVTSLAESCERRMGRRVRREEVSMCIHQRRSYPEVQRAIAEELGVTVDTLFGQTKLNSLSNVQ